MGLMNTKEISPVPEIPIVPVVSTVQEVPAVPEVPADSKVTNTKSTESQIKFPKLDKKHLVAHQYPISYFRSTGCFDVVGCFGDKDSTELANIITKDRNIIKLSKVKELYLSHGGYNDGDPWHLICSYVEPVTERKFYLFLDASCDYTGFDCRGEGKICVAYDWDKFYQLCLTDDIRNDLVGGNVLKE